MPVPIPQRKPDFSQPQGSLFDTVKDAVNGAFHSGLDILSQQLAVQNQIKLLKYQNAAALQADNTNATGGQGTPAAPTFAQQGPSIFGSISPVTIAILGVAVLILLRK